MQMLSKESLEYGDILQINVNDVYKHLTYKTLSGFLWSKKFCPNAKFIIKMDDNNSLYWNFLIGTLKTKHPLGFPKTDLIECYSPIRNLPYYRKTSHPGLMSKW